MPTIREVKTELRHREWAEQIQECQSSGMTVTAWCKEKGISQHTYYSRLNVVRKELLKRAELPLQQIVPLSVSQSVTCTTAAVQTQCVADNAEPGKPEPAVPQKMIVRKGCPRDMCRWSFGYERSRKYGISTDRITTLYRSSSKKHAEICRCKKQEGVCQRFENHLSCTV